MEMQEMNEEGSSAADRAAGHRALAAMAIAVVALLISCVAMMLIDWRSPRAAPLTPPPAETAEAPAAP
jgi:hypothetical protein